MAGNSEETTKREVPEHLKEHQWKPGQSGNPSGRPKNVMKDFMRQRFKSMSDKARTEFLEEVAHIDQIKLAEGNPHSTTDITSDDKPIPLFGNVHPDDSNEENKKTD